jgi:hypothetical protein
MAEGVEVPKGPVQPARHGEESSGREHAHLIVRGKIRTLNPKSQEVVEAMAITDGQVVATGAFADLENLQDSSTKILDVQGVVVPGLIEPHMHIWSTALSENWTDLSHRAAPTFDDAVAIVKGTAAKTPAGGWVLAKLFDPSLYPGEPDLTRDILDQVAPDNPVVVMNASLHYIYINSKSMAEVGLNDQSVDPPGGSFGRVDGKLNGVVAETAAMLQVLAGMPKQTSAEFEATIRRVLVKAASAGVTSVREGLTGAVSGTGEFHLLQQLNGGERLATRVSTAQAAALPGIAAGQVAKAWKEAGVTPFGGDRMVRADAWKIQTDGSNQGRSGYFSQPYLGENNGGHANMTPEELRRSIAEGLSDGWQLMIHTNGDAAVEFALEALADTLPKNAPGDLRHRLEHVSFTTEEQLATMAELGVSPSFLMNHVYYWGGAFRDTILGPERAGRLDRFATALANNLRVSLHSDYNVTEIQPLLSAQTAVTRVMQANGEVLNPEECVTPAQALRAITTDAAWQIHADDRGSLSVGNRADFAVLSEDPWGADPSAWVDIDVHQTFIDGEVAYQA